MAAQPWLPIETAPKDGTEIDLWVIRKSTGQGGRRPNCYWGRRTFGAEYVGDPTWCGLDDQYSVETPTHWMPKPSDPAEQPDEDAGDGWEWMLVEVLGHRRHTGRVREEERFGAKLLRIDVPVKGDPAAHGWQTHYYAPASLYGLTPCDRDTAMKANKPYDPPARLALSRRDDEDSEGMPF